MGRRRKNPDNTAIGDLISVCNNMMHNRSRVLNPFTIDPLIFYDYVWNNRHDRDEINRLHATYPTAFNTEDSINITVAEEVPVNVNFNEFLGDIPFMVRTRIDRVLIALPTPLPMVTTNATWRTNNVKLTMESFPDDIQNNLREWVSTEASLYIEKYLLGMKLEELECAAKTPGQAYRLWPEIINLLPTSQRARIENAKAKSRLTASQDDIAKFTPSCLTKYNALIAEACLFDPITTYHIPKIKFTVIKDMGNAQMFGNVTDWLTLYNNL